MIDDPWWGTGGSQGTWVATNAQSADPVVLGENRAIDNQSFNIAIANVCTPSTGRVIENNSNQPALPFTDRQNVGTQDAVSWMQQDSSRRTYGGAVGGYPNIAWQPPAAGPFVTAPDGTNTAYSLSAGSFLSIFDEGSTASQALATGDRLMWGCWHNWYTGGGSTPNRIYNTGGGNIQILLGGFVPYGNTTQTLTPGGSTQFIRWLPDAPGGNAIWLWSWGWLKVVSHGTGLIQVRAGIDGTGAIWRPYAAILPAASSSTISDSEVAAYIMHAQPPPNVRKAGTPDIPVSPPAGAYSRWPGQTDGWWDATAGVWRTTYVDGGVLWVV
jgi:hypothetical protein